MNHSNILRFKLEEKIQLEWEQKWFSFGIYDAKKQNRRSKFYEILAKEISDQTGFHISRDTVFRFNQGDGGDSLASLIVFAKYLGYDDYEDFKVKNPVVNSSFDASKKVRDIKQEVIIIGVLLAFFIVFASYKFIINSRERASIIELIHKANEAQFEAYKQLPRIDSMVLSNYYLKPGNAYKSILAVLYQNQAKGRQICEPKYNPSYFKILDTQILKIKDKQAIVQTEEHWFLKWYDIHQKQFVVSYDVKNQQLYELKKVNDSWFIEHNFFEGKATKIDY